MNDKYNEPGTLNSKDFDYHKYISAKEINNPMCMVDDLSYKNSFEPGSKNLPYDAYNLGASLAMLSDEILNLYEASTITKIRKVQIQYFIDSIKMELKNFNGSILFEETNKKVKGDIHVLVHGSFATGLATMLSFLDLALFYEDLVSHNLLEEYKELVLKCIFNHFHKAENFQVDLISNSHALGLKIKHKNVPIPCILTIATNNMTLETLLTRRLVQCEAAFVPILMFVRQWIYQTGLYTIHHSVKFIITMLAKMFLDNNIVNKNYNPPSSVEINDHLGTGILYYSKPVDINVELGALIYIYTFNFLRYFAGVYRIGVPEYFNYLEDIAMCESNSFGGFLKSKEVSTELICPNDAFVLIIDPITKVNVAASLTELDFFNIRLKFREYALKVIYRKDVFTKNIFE